MIQSPKLSVSNICWAEGRDTSAYTVLRDNGVRFIDIAPTKLFNKPLANIERDDAETYRVRLRTHELAIAALQSLTYGTQGNILTGSRSERLALQDRVRASLRLAGYVGAHTIIYGSPATRILGENIDAKEASARALDFFSPLDRVADEIGVTLGIEPVSPTWTAGQPAFGQTSAEIVDFADYMHREGFQSTRLVVDTFAMHDANENPEMVLRNAAARKLVAPHMQIAEASMGPHSEASQIDHRSFSQACRDIIPALIDSHPTVVPTIAIEMMPDQSPKPVAMARLARIIKTAKANYELD